MNRKIPTAVAVTILIAVAGAFAIWVYFGDTYFRQTRRMGIAREYLPVITNAVYSCPQFRDARVGVGTGAGGCFLVYGMVDTEAQLSELESVIAATKPPLTVLYRLKVLERYSGTNSQAER